MTTTPLPAFRAVLRACRLRAGLTQEQLATQAGLSLNAVSALERGVNQQPRKDTVRLLADALGLALEERTVFAAAARRAPAATVPVAVAVSATTPLLEQPPENTTAGGPSDDATAELPVNPWRDGAGAETTLMAPWSVAVAEPATPAPARVQPPLAAPHAGTHRRRWGVAVGLITLAGLVLWAWTHWPAPPPVPAPDLDTWYVVGGLDLNPLDLSADGVAGITVGRVFTATFRVRNASHQPATMQGFAVGIRRPTNCASVWDGTAYDFPPVERTITLQPGEEFVYQRAQMLYEPGSYFAEPLKLDNRYKWGGIGPFPRVWFRVTDPRARQTPDRGCLPTPPAATLSP